jgi:hypothetical protein
LKGEIKMATTKKNSEASAKKSSANTEEKKGTDQYSNNVDPSSVPSTKAKKSKKKVSDQSHNGVPSKDIPNAETIKAMKDVQNNVNMSGPFNSVEDLMNDLNHSSSETQPKKKKTDAKKKNKSSSEDTKLKRTEFESDTDSDTDCPPYNPKYELASETKTIDTGGRDIILHRIKALKDFGTVHKGDLGGWIEKEENLSQFGKCWIYDNAEAFNFARVSDDAQMFDNSAIYGHSRLSGHASIHAGSRIEDSIVCGFAIIRNKVLVTHEASIYGHTILDNNLSNPFSAIIIDGITISDGEWHEQPLVISTNKYIMNMVTKKKLRINRPTHTIHKWLKDWDKLSAKELRLTPADAHFYKKCVKLFAEKYGK